MRRGQNPSAVLEALREKIEHVNDEVLPKDVTIRPFYDRTELVRTTLQHAVGARVADRGQCHPALARGELRSRCMSANLSSTVGALGIARALAGVGVARDRP